MSAYLPIRAEKQCTGLSVIRGIAAGARKINGLLEVA